MLSPPLPGPYAGALHGLHCGREFILGGIPTMGRYNQPISVA